MASRLKAGTLGKNEALLMLRGRLGFRRLIPTWTFGVAGSQTLYVSLLIFVYSLMDSDERASLQKKQCFE